VGQLNQRFREVTGLHTLLSFGSRILENGRQYLHRLEIVSGAVVSCQTMGPTPLKQVSFHVEQSCTPQEQQVAPRRLDTEMPEILVTNEVVSPDVIEITDPTGNPRTSGAHVGQLDSLNEKENYGQASNQNGKRPAIVNASSGHLWSGSSRRRLLSTGKASTRGPGGAGALLSDRIDENEIDGVQHQSMPGEEDSGGFIVID